MSIDKINDRSRNLFSRVLISYLTHQTRAYHAFSVTPTETLRDIMRRGDVLLIEGNQRFSTAVKYLTQSTWSHAALFVGNAHSEPRNAVEPMELVEASLEHGVTYATVSKYDGLNTRICRPLHLTEEDGETVVQFMINRIGYQYDLKNVTDLARYLLPMPPVPSHWRRRMLAFGSGDPTRVICSTLIAQAFQDVRYPILPDIEKIPVELRAQARHAMRDVMHIRHHSLYTPRDFDISPYFAIIKPTLERDFDYKHVEWNDAFSRGVGD